MGNIETVKKHLIEQLSHSGITDQSVLNVMTRVPREMFMAEAFRDKAYENSAFPIGFHQTISQPEIVGLMTQALDLTDRCKVLEIGTGSGYQSAILARLCRRLYTTERIPKLSKIAVQRFHDLEIRNITALARDGSLGWPEQAPFDRIIVTCAAIDIPPILLDQLAVGGIMVIPIGLEERDQRLVKVLRTSEGAETEDLGGVRFVPLVAGMA